ncbi:DUF695 domain-containing protein [Chitinophaga flava]|uniref:DUF695 domain-containing protein n=1 Tax=Chitinophaga flava TaxID=2259036 RepID=A0A365Y496_9BACT|nr:DUF695 domain-containing protein [Chitinophaga flava]RBL93330.1 hypothetical protein DF182_12455 [Chitinophaga flava]
MKYILLIVVLLFSIPLFAQTVEDHWETYTAQYDDGVGSTIVNMSLLADAPIVQYPFLVKISVKINRCNQDGFPMENEWDGLYLMSDKLKAVFAVHGPFKAVGTFTIQCWRTDYYYVKDTVALRQALTAAAKKYQPTRECMIETRSDPKWNSYLKFLYPNEETFEYIKNQKVVIPLSQNGDKLTKPRQVDHWLYFKTEAGRNRFISYAQQQRYKIEDKKLSARSDFPYQLHLSRVDNVDLPTISKITLQLRRKVKEYDGTYDGWETFVIKK